MAAGHTHLARMAQKSPNAAPMLDLNALEKFVDALPIPAVVPWTATTAAFVRA